MPAWLVTILAAIIKPIVEDLIDKMMLNARLNAIESSNQKMAEAMKMLSNAKTPEEIQSAAHKASSAWNSFN